MKAQGVYMIFSVKNPYAIPCRYRLCAECLIEYFLSLRFSFKTLEQTALVEYPNNDTSLLKKKM